MCLMIDTNNMIVPTTVYKYKWKTTTVYKKSK